LELVVAVTGLGQTSNALGFHTCQVLSSSEPNLAVLSPGGVPAVVDYPVGGRARDSPADDLDGVSSQVLTRDLVVDSALVAHEVVIDIEGALNRSVVVDLSLDGSGIGADLVVVRALVLISGVGSGVSGTARRRAFRGLSFGSRAALGSAWRDLVRLATAVGSVPAASDNTGHGPVLHGINGVSTLASITAIFAAGHNVFGGEAYWRLGLVQEDFALGLASHVANANTIFNDFRSGDGPAASAVSLILNVVDGRGALGPLVLAREEGSGESSHDDVLDTSGGALRVLAHSGAHQSLDCCLVLASEVFIVTCRPCGLRIGVLLQHGLGRDILIVRSVCVHAKETQHC